MPTISNGKQISKIISQSLNTKKMKESVGERDTEEGGMEHLGTSRGWDSLRLLLSRNTWYPGQGLLEKTGAVGHLEPHLCQPFPSVKSVWAPEFRPGSPCSLRQITCRGRAPGPCTCLCGALEGSPASQSGNCSLLSSPLECPCPCHSLASSAGLA